MRGHTCVAAMWLVASLVAGHGQEPSFQVASVKANSSGDPVSRITAPPGTGRFDATNAPLRILILNAYGLSGFQLVGGPSLLDSLRVDIAARTDTTATRDEIRLMLRTLLAERFHLAVHRERREMPVYALVSARRDGRLGPRLRASTTDCAATATTRGNAPRQSPSGQLLCDTRISPASINAGGISMTRLAATLSGIVGRLVTDETNLTGTYDLQLTFTPESSSSIATPSSPVDPDAPSIFAAVQEQLGLKLDARRGSVDVLMIDHIAAPDQN